METIKEEKKADPKLWELKKGARVKIGNMIAEFLGVDGMYCRWKVEGGENITIMGTRKSESVRVWRDSRRLIRLLYYLPMERMKHTGDYELDRINMLEQECADLEEENKRLEEENKKLKETIKDHQLYEEKLEHRIIEFEELLHGE